MEITRKNFNETLSLVTDAIKQSSFIAIDTEFTGLDSTNSNNAAPFDTPEERFIKIRKGSADFLLIQFGLCTFQYDEDAEKFEVRPFNFYLFPRPYSRTSPDMRFLCQSSSIDFLASQGFDFNKAFREGISHLTRSHETQLREALQQKHQSFSQFSSPAFMTPDGQSSSFVSKGPVSIPEEQKEFVKNIVEKVRDFLDNSDKEILELPPFNGFQRKLVYQTVRLEFTSGVHLETKTGEKKERYIVVTRVKTEEDLKKKEEEKQASEFSELEDAVGFRKVIDALSQSGKLIVGHNILLDITHTLNHFFYPVPEDYQEFKAMVKSAFPKLLDTKLMASTNPFKERIFSSVLSDLQKITELEPFKKPEVVFPESFDQYSSSNDAKLHEAGYDAYICGLCFISMCNYLGSFQNPPCTTVLPKSPLIEPFINKIFLMRILDIPYMDLSGQDLSPNRDHVFHVTFPKEWKASDLFQLFQPYGNIFIGWIDETSAYAALSNKDNTPDVLKSLCSKENNVYKVIPYAQFKAKKNNDNDNASSARKRPLSIEMEPPPNKKRKSLNVDAPPFVSRSITPPTVCDDNGVPISAKNISPELDNQKENVSNNGKEEKMFTEPDNW